LPFKCNLQRYSTDALSDAAQHLDGVELCGRVMKVGRPKGWVDMRPPEGAPGAPGAPGAAEGGGPGGDGAPAAAGADAMSAANVASGPEMRAAKAGRCRLNLLNSFDT
jgi:hypothetical protein